MSQNALQRFLHRGRQAFSQIHVLTSDQVERLPKQPQIVRIQSGKAWISVRNQDVILSTGEMVAVDATQHGTVISVIGQKPVVYEIDPENSESSY